MAKQMGIFPMQGNIDNITFFKTKDGFQARKKGGVSGDRIMNDPEYKRTREHILEFTRCMKGAALIRKALLKAVNGSSDRRSINRLMPALLEITRKDPTNNRGKRVFTHSLLETVKGFEFNAASLMEKAVKLQIQSGIDRASGVCTIQIPAYEPEKEIALQADATHYRFRLVAAAIDFEASEYEMSTEVSDYLLMDTMEETAPLTLTASLTANHTDPIFLALTVEFVQETEEGIKYPLLNGTFNPCRLERVAV